MHTTIQGTYQIGTLFGYGFVAEQHSEQTRRWLPIADERPLIEFDELLKTLRSALSL
jgi:hypothetical protein